MRVPRWYFAALSMGVSVPWIAPTVVLCSALVSCETPGLEVELLRAPAQVGPQAMDIVAPYALPLDYDQTAVCARIPNQYRGDALREAIVDASDDTVRLHAELFLNDGRILATHFAYIETFKGGNYYCLGSGSTKSEADRLRTKRPSPVVRSLRVWSNRALWVDRLVWQASNAP